MSIQVREMPPISLNTVENPDHVSEFWNWLTSHHEFIAADTETTSLNVYETGFKVRLLQFGDCNTGWAIPFQGWRGLAEGSFKWLSDHRVRTIWHNLSFDQRALASEGVNLDISTQEDTYIWASLLGFADHSRALKSIAEREFGPWAVFGQKLLETGMKNAGWGWDTVPMEYKPYSAYGAMDPVLGAMYWTKHQAEMAPYQWHHSLEMLIIEATNRMARLGVGVDTIYCNEQIAILEEQEEEILARLRGYGIESPGQNAAVARVLEEAGVLPEVVELTETGQIAVGKDFLATIHHPVAEDVLLARHVSKIKGYLIKLFAGAGGELTRQGIAHPEIRSMEAKTGRSSVADPALQQLPSPDPNDPLSLVVRRALVARSADEELVGADFGQIELRMFASITGDKALMNVLNQADAAKAADPNDPAGDFFVMMGRDLYDPSFVKKDPRRGLLKATSYATLYSGGIETIARTAKVPVNSVQIVLDQMKSKYTAFQTLGDELIQENLGPSWQVNTPTGRRFSVSKWSERRKLMNYLVQGHSAEILKMAVLNVIEAGYGDNLMLPVHDELIMSVPREKAKQARRDLVECMNAVINADEYGVAVQASPANIAHNWGDLDH